MYRLFFHLVLRHFDPEASHELAKRALRGVRAIRPGRVLLARWAPPPDPVLAVRALGRTFSSPLGVAAGVDKDGTWVAELAALGFGFVEVGTVTARAQAGNPRPRIARLIGDRALINWMGFPNPGAEAVAARLALGRPGAPGGLEPRPEVVVGVNLGKSRDAPLDEAVSDYQLSIRRLAPVADYIALNVSSPNTPGLRELQSPERLRELIAAVRSELEARDPPVPLLIKIAPDLSDEEVDVIAKLALELELDGIVAVNTTTALPEAARGEPSRGGLSGPPLAGRAEAVLRRLHATSGGRLVLISVGGIESGQDVWDRLRAGATLVQAYTGFVYGGPGWPSRVNRELARRVRQAGYGSIQDLLDAAGRPAAARAPLAS